MLVWIVNPFDTLPAEGSRPLRFWLMAEAFVRAGHDVVYWTADFNHVTKKARTIGGPPRPESGIKVEMVHEPPYSRNVGLARLWAHWRWAKNWRRAAERAPHPGLIVVSSPPLAIGAEVRRFAAKCGAKVVVDVMDAWPETFERVAPRCTLWPLRRLARANYLGADVVTTVADNYAELVRKYGCKSPVRRFYHGIEMSGSAFGASASPRASGARIVYVGNLGMTYDLVTAMEAVLFLDGVSLEIAGKGDGEAALRQFAESPKFCGRVSFRGYLCEAELAELLASCDIGIVPMAPESCVGVPYKFADYARSGLAVVSSLGGESDKLLAKYGAGASYRVGDPQSLAESVRRLLPRLAETKAASRRLAEGEFDAERIYDEYVRFALLPSGV